MTGHDGITGGGKGLEVLGTDEVDVEVGREGARRQGGYR